MTISLEKREEVKRLILSGGTLREVSKRAGVGRGTAQKLRDELREAGQITSPEKGLNAGGWPSREKFLAVVATSGMNEYEKGEYCRAHGIYAEQLEMWREACISANGPSDGKASELRASLREETLKNRKLERELIHAQGKGSCGSGGDFGAAKKSGRDLGGRRGRLIEAPDRVTTAALIEEAAKSGARKDAACKELGISVRTLQRWARDGGAGKDGRKGAPRKAPANKLSEGERAKALEIANSAGYMDKPPSQIVPDLADKGIYVASESTFYRVLREAGQYKHRGRSAAPKKRAVCGHCATGPDQVWSWDITWLPGAVKGLYLYLYLIIDIFSRKIVGWEVYDCESSENASELILRSVISESPRGCPFVLHSDNGSPMKGSSLLMTLHNLGVEASYSRPGVSNDNPYSESIFRTLKYRPVYPYRGFAGIKASRKWVNDFVAWYNGEHRHSGLNFITPGERHSGLGEGIMERRKSVYGKAKAAHPNRWSKNIRQMNLPEEVWLNPPSKSNKQAQKVVGL